MHTGRLLVEVNIQEFLLRHLPDLQILFRKPHRHRADNLVLLEDRGYENIDLFVAEEKLGLGFLFLL